MDAERFDGLTRKLSSGQTRRRALGALGALFALGLQRGRAAQLGPPACGDAGDVCTMLAGCCDGLTCVTSAINTNYGVCVSGGDGGTVASGTSLVSPFSESAQATGTVDSTTTDTTTTTTTGTTTTSTTTPQAERQAKLQERRNRRSTRRNKIQSRRNTKSTSRKTRREDASEVAVLDAGPQLRATVDSDRVKNTSEGAEVYDVITVTNYSELSVTLQRIKTLNGLSDVEDIDTTLDTGESVDLVMGTKNGDGLPSGSFWWSNRRYCVIDPTDGFEITSSFSNSVENHVNTIYCNGETDAVATDQTTNSGNRKKRKRKHQASAKRKRKQNKKDR